MERFFKRLSIVLSIILIFNVIVFSYDVKANNLITGPSTNFNWFDWSIEALREIGLIFDPSITKPTPLQMAEEINQKDPEANVQPTNESINNYINNNTTYDNQNNSKTYNSKVKNVINYTANYYSNQTPYTYLYGCDLDASRSWFGNNFNECKKILQDNPTHLELIKGYYPNSNVYVQDINISRFPTYAVHKQTYNADWEYIDLYTAYLSGNEVIIHPFTAYDNNDLVIYDALPDTLNEITNIQYPFSPEGQWWGYMNTSPGKSCDGDEWYYYPKYFSANNNGIMEFNLLSDLENYVREYGNGKYFSYKNNTVYNNYKNSGNNTYTVTNDNSNKVTYRDINNYIDNSVRETGDYPSLPDIEIWIESNPDVPSPTPTPTPTPIPTSNPDNPSGGGQGGNASANNEGINITINNNHNINLGGGSGLSGNTVSGNGSGSSGGIGGIFDFLSQIGDFLGSLIKNIGNVLADIVTGIGSVVSSLLEVIPTVFNDFLGGVLGWLPPELRALVTLSISAMIIVGLIKLFRG